MEIWLSKMQTDALKEIADREGVTVNELLDRAINLLKTHQAKLASAIEKIRAEDAELLKRFSQGVNGDSALEN